MLRSHHHLLGFVKLVLWDVYCVNGYGSFRLGYVGVVFWEETVTAGMVSLMLGGGFCGFGYSGIFSLFFGISCSRRGLVCLRGFCHVFVCEIYATL